MNEINEKYLAVLIDAENISAKNIKNMVTEISRYGTPTIKRIYGDWTKPDLGRWKNVLLEHAIIPMQQYGYTSGKNSSDSAMIIDAMDILYTGNVDGFCIVSSDSDFTRLAVRLREAGKVVYGIGEKKTPNSFIAACSKFIFLEILEDAADSARAAVPVVLEEPKAEPAESAAESKEKAQSPASDAALPKIPDKMIREDLKRLISSSVADLADEDGWAYLAAVGAHINKKQPEFDPRNYGYQRLTPLLRSLRVFELDERVTGNSKTRQIYVRNKSEEAPKPKRKRRGAKTA